MRRWAFVALLLGITAAAAAHFPFIVPDAGGAAARLVMSETLDPDTEVGIEILTGTKLSLRGGDGRDAPLTLSRADHWMSLTLPGEGTRVVHGVADLGVMKRGKPHLLIYHPKTIVGDAFDPATILGDAAPVELIPVRADGGFRLKLLIGGAPAAGAELRLVNAEGDEADYTTDGAGLTETFGATGRFAAWARHWVDEPGDRDGVPYEQVRRYATLVFDIPAPAPAEEPALVAPLVRTPLPQPVASFGAVESGGWLYVYGGHTARRHEYSSASVSGRFHRLNLGRPAGWEELPAGVAVQGMNLATHAGKIYRVGGMQPRNAPGEASDSWSLADAAYFDPATRRWSPLPALSSPRSSHDLVVVDGTLLALGGWEQRGRDAEPVWHESIETLDVSRGAQTWERVPQPFARRALIAAVLGGRVWVMGGFDDEDNASLDVDVYDTASRTWTAGPSIPGETRNGFSPAACVHGGTIYLSVAAGDLYRLSADAGRWEPIARTTPRVVHRLVAFGPEILIVGGAANARMLDLVEAIRITDAAGGR